MIANIVLLLIFFLVTAAVLYGFVKLFRANVRMSKKKFGDASAALLPLIAGTANADKLTGTYCGKSVTAHLLRQVESGGTDGDRDVAYYFVTSLTAGPGHANWSLVYTGDALMGLGTKSWHIRTKDEALKQRLTEAGALDAVARLGDHKPEIAYGANDGIVSATSPRSYRKTYPDAAAFKNTLEALAALADCNVRANVALLST
ncbi:MAG: hypothetical protein NVSMB19_10480 [Vulcanimicrobiaceae bacterium]